MRVSREIDDSACPNSVVECMKERKKDKTMTGRTHRGSVPSAFCGAIVQTEAAKPRGETHTHTHTHTAYLLAS